MLRIPKENVGKWASELADECMSSAEERSMVYGRAHQYYYTGSADSKAAIFNKTKPFVDKLSGFLMQPTDVRFQIVFDSEQPDDVLNRAELISEKLSADYRQTDADICFADTLTMSLVNGCYLLKHKPDGDSFKIAPVHPENFGVLSETVLSLEEQEAFCHVSYPTVSRLSAMLDEIQHPHRDAIM